MKSTAKKLFENLKELTLINFIVEFYGYYNYQPPKEEIKLPNKNYNFREKDLIIRECNVPKNKTTFYFKVKNEEKPKKNDKHKKTSMRIRRANLPSECIRLNNLN